jgi:ring-1,2-phenylacetyl-CoA epoxidase subunit PaaD
MVMSTAPAPDIEHLRAAVEAVCDPELPPLTLVDLGILRSVEVDDDDTVVVSVTPTYSGCPAVEYIEDEIARVLRANDCDRFRVERSFSPAWTTDWITDDGRRKLIEIGIAPPGPSTGAVPVRFGRRPAIPCPRCGSTNTEEISRFGSTACKALHRCRSCAEPFDSFKAI